MTISIRLSHLLSHFDNNAQNKSFQAGQNQLFVMNLPACTERDLALVRKSSILSYVAPLFELLHFAKATKDFH